MTGASYAIAVLMGICCFLGVAGAPCLGSPPTPVSGPFRSVGCREKSTASAPGP